MKQMKRGSKDRQNYLQCLVQKIDKLKHQCFGRRQPMRTSSRYCGKGKDEGVSVCLSTRNLFWSFQINLQNHINFTEKYGDYYQCW